MNKNEVIELLEKEKAYMLSHGGDKQSEALDMAINSVKQETVSRESYDNEFVLRKEFEVKAYKLQRQLEKVEHNLDKIRAEIMGKIEQEEFARSIFRHEEKDTFKAEQCTGSIMAYNNVIKLIDKYKAGSEV